MSRLKTATERIRKDVSLCQVLADYGYAVDPRAEGRGQQFSCDLHGGQDNAPSAHLYPDTGQFFCFACGKSRDAIALVREKEGVPFWKAVRILEGRYGLEPLPWEEDEDKPQSPIQGLLEALNPQERVEDSQRRVERFLVNVTSERSLPPIKCASLWEAFDRVSAFRNDGGKDADALTLYHKILLKAKEALKNPEG